VAFDKEQVTELRLADTYSVFQHGLEYRLQITGRRTDDAKYLGRRRLLFPRLGELPFQFGTGFADAGDARCRLRSGRTKLATVRPALRAFARQGHPRSPHTGCHKPRIKSCNVKRIARRPVRV